jgi:hypothetical protein
MDIRDIAEAAISLNAGYAMVHIGVPPIVRVHDILQPTKLDKVDAEAMERLILSMPDGVKLMHSLTEQSVVETRVHLDHPKMILLATFFHESLGHALHLRLIATRTPTLKDLALPSIVDKITNCRRGLVVVASDARGGKTTTAYSILNHINLNRSVTILTCERLQTYELAHRISVIAFHAPFFTHLYLGQSESAFQLWPDCPTEYQSLWNGAAYEHRADMEPMTQSSTLDYIAFLDSIVAPTVEALDLDSDETGFPWYPDMSKLSHELMSLRHLQGHVGQLSELLMAPQHWH